MKFATSGYEFGSNILLLFSLMEYVQGKQYRIMDHPTIINFMSSYWNSKKIYCAFNKGKGFLSSILVGKKEQLWWLCQRNII